MQDWRQNRRFVFHFKPVSFMVSMDEKDKPSIFEVNVYKKFVHMFEN